MESFTPVAQSTMIEPVRPSILNANLFKNVIIPPPEGEKLVSYLRIRPIPSNSEKESPYEVINDRRLVTKPPKESKAYKNLKEGETGVKSYLFDHIFNTDTAQEDFYNGTALPLVNRSLRGESSLLFAYGTTNSGKSFTMRGTSEQMGIIPRSLNHIFNALGDRVASKPLYKPGRFAEADLLTDNALRKEKDLCKFICSNVKNSDIYSSFLSLSRSGIESFVSQDELSSQDFQDKKFAVWISYFEFYLDNLKDLLAVEEKGKKPDQLLLVPDQNENYYVKGLRQVQVSNVNEAYKCLLYGWESIHRAATTLNADSSRSHCIFTVTLISYDDSPSSRGIHFVSNLSFCDLAGTERGNRTHNTGNRLKEAAKINTSLMVLKQCVTALRANQKPDCRQRVVPFRDSPLTKFFKSYFNGTGFATMIININPSIEYYDETLISLQFSIDASDLTVPPKEARLRLKNSVCRLTQQWMQSSQRWSSFAPASSVQSSCIVDETTETEDETESADYQSQLERTLLENINPDVIAALAEHIEEVNEKFEKDRLIWEMDIRKEVADKMQVIHQEQIKEYEETIASMKRDHEQALTKSEDWYKKRIHQIRKELQSRNEDLKNQMETINEAHKKEIEALEREKEILARTNREYQQKGQEDDQVVAMSESLKQELESLKKQLKSLGEENESLNEEKKSLQKTIDSQNNEIESQRKDIASLGKNIESQKQDIERQRKEIEAQSKQIEAQKKEIEAQRKEIEAQRKNIEAQRKEIDAQRKEMEAQRKGIEPLSKAKKDHETSKLKRVSPPQIEITADVDSAEDTTSVTSVNTDSHREDEGDSGSFIIHVNPAKKRKKPACDEKKESACDAYLRALRKKEIEATPAFKAKRKKPVLSEEEETEEEERDDEATLISEDDSTDGEDEIGRGSKTMRSTRSTSSRVTRSRAQKGKESAKSKVTDSARKGLPNASRKILSPSPIQQQIENEQLQLMSSRKPRTRRAQTTSKKAKKNLF